MFSMFSNESCFILIQILLELVSWHRRHNDYGGVSNHQPRGCLLKRLFRRKSKETSKLRVTGLCVGNSPGPVNSPHKGPVTRKMFPFDDFIMSQGPIDNKLLLVQVIAWCNRPRSEDFVFSVIWILSKGLLQNFAYVTSIVLLKDVQDFIMIL